MRRKDQCFMCNSRSCYTRIYIQVNKKKKHLGWFETKDEAKIDRREAEIKYYGGYANAG